MNRLPLLVVHLTHITEQMLTGASRLYLHPEAEKWVLGGSEAGGMGASQTLPGSLSSCPLGPGGSRPLLYDNSRLMLDLQK